MIPDFKLSFVKVHSTPRFASDHHPASIDIISDTDSPPSPSEPVFSFSKEKEDKWIKEISLHLHLIQDSITAQSL